MGMTKNAGFEKLTGAVMKKKGPCQEVHAATILPPKKASKGKILAGLACKCRAIWSQVT